MRFRRLLVPWLVASLLTSLVGSAALASPAPQPSHWQSAAKLLTRFRIIAGDPDGDLRPGDTITRAEMAKILVAAQGHGEMARMMTGAGAFADTRSHWSSGWVAVAKNAGWVSGDPGGTFRPDAPVNFGEAITMLARFVSLPPAGGNWPDNYLHAAASAGIVPADMDLRGRAGERADRGSVFVLAHATFLGIKDADGKSTYQRVHDSVAPRLNVEALPNTTQRPTLRIQGDVNENALVAVSGLTISPQASGAFAHELPLRVGANNIVVTARDEVGNESRFQTTIERVNTQPARIDVPDAVTVAAGATAPLAAAVRDTNGEVVMGAPLQVSVVGEVGAFDPVAGTFTAASRVGSGRLDLTSGDLRASVTITIVPGPLARLAVQPDDIALAPGMLQGFTARGQDALGNDLGPVNPAWSTESGQAIIDASGRFTAIGQGLIRVTANLADVKGEATVHAYGPAARLKIHTVSGMTADGATQTEVRVEIQDADGNRVANHDGRVTLTLGAGTAAGFAGTDGNLDPTSRFQTRVAAGGYAGFTLVAGMAPGDVLLHASAAGLAGNTVSLPVTAQQMAGADVTMDTQQLAADGISTTKVRVRLLDQNGSPYLGGSVGGWKATLVSSDEQIIQVPGTAYATPDATGVGHITATVQARNGVGAATLSVTVLDGAEVRAKANFPMTTMLVGEPFRLAAAAAASATARQQGGSEALTLTFRVQDVNGNQVTRLNSFAGFNLRLQSSDDKYIAIIAPSGGAAVQRSIPPAGVLLDAANAAIHSGKITVKVASALAQTAHFTLGGSYGDSSLQPAEVDGAFLPGPAGSLTLEADPDGTTDGAGAGLSATLTATVRDRAQLDLTDHALTAANRVATGNYPVKFVRTAGDTTRWPGTQVATSADGQAVVLVAAGSAIGSDSFRASFAPNESQLLESNTAQVQVAIFGGALRLALTGPAGTITAGGDARVRVKVQDGQTPPRTVTSDNTTFVTLTVKDAAGGLTSTYTAMARNGTARFTVTGLTAAGGYTLAATASGLESASGSMTVVPGPARRLVGTMTAPIMGASGDSVSTLHVFAADAYGNRRPDDLVHAGIPQVTVSSGDPSIVTVEGLTCTNTGSGTSAVCKATLRGTPNVGTATLSARMPGQEAWTGEVTTVIVGPPAMAEVIPADDATAGNSHTVRVRVNDANGNRVTHSGQQAWLRVTVGGDGYTVDNTDLATADGGDNGHLTNWVRTQQGEATFRVMTTRAGQIRYTVAVVNDFGSETAVAGTRTLSADAAVAAGRPDRVALGLPSPRSIPGDGYAVSMITARITDAYGNPTAISGAFTFEVVAADPGLPGGAAYAVLQATGGRTQTVTAPGGTATVLLQSRYATNQGTVDVAATFTPDDSGVALSQKTAAITRPAGDTAPPLTVTVP